MKLSLDIYWTWVQTSTVEVPQVFSSPNKCSSKNGVSNVVGEPSSRDLLRNHPPIFGVIFACRVGRGKEVCPPHRALPTSALPGPPPCPKSSVEPGTHGPLGLHLDPLRRRQQQNSGAMTGTGASLTSGALLGLSVFFQVAPSPSKNSRSLSPFDLLALQACNAFPALHCCRLPHSNQPHLHPKPGLSAPSIDWPPTRQRGQHAPSCSTPCRPHRSCTFHSATLVLTKCSLLYRMSDRPSSSQPAYPFPNELAPSLALVGHGLTTRDTRLPHHSLTGFMQDAALRVKASASVW